MKSFIFKFNFALFLCLILSSCKLNIIKFWEKSSLPVIAEVDNSVLYVRDLKELAIEDSVSKEELVNYVESWINFEVMYFEALKRGLQKDKETQKLIKDAEKKILVDRLKLTMDNTLEVHSEKELQEFYENNKEKFRIDSVEFIEFAEAMPKIRAAVISEKGLKKEKEWLIDVKNNYSIEVYPQYLDSL